jgi:hypothetical protein
MVEVAMRLVGLLTLLALVACGETSGAGGVGGMGGASKFPCTEAGIRAAVAEGGGPHFFDCHGPTTVVTEAEIVIDSDVILDGEGELTIDADGMHRVLSTSSGVEVEFRGVVVTGGADLVGGIWNEGTMTLTNSTVSDNTSTGSGGGILNRGTLMMVDSTVSRNSSIGTGGGILNQGTMTLTNSTVSDNTSTATSGGIDNTDTGTLTLFDCTVSGNAATRGGTSGISNRGGELAIVNSTVSGNITKTRSSGAVSNDRGNVLIDNSTVTENTHFGIYNRSTGTLTIVDSEVSRNWGGGIHSSGMLTLFNSTVSENTGAEGAGILTHRDGPLRLTNSVRLINSTVSGNTATERHGGGIRNCNGTLTVTNSTISSNSAALGGGGISLCGAESDTTLSHVTLTGNTAGRRGDGISNTSQYDEIGAVALMNSIVDGDCEGPVSSAGGNLESPGDTCGLDQPTDQRNLSAEDLALAPLQDNGGPTKTHALLQGSVAVDQIALDACRVDQDQRGELRAWGEMPLCDVGAFEVQP